MSTGTARDAPDGILDDVVWKDRSDLSAGADAAREHPAMTAFANSVKSRL